jgi:hypothetical protein
MAVTWHLVEPESGLMVTAAQARSRIFDMHLRKLQEKLKEVQVRLIISWEELLYIVYNHVSYRSVSRSHPRMKGSTKGL